MNFWGSNWSKTLKQRYRPSPDMSGLARVVRPELLGAAGAEDSKTNVMAVSPLIAAELIELPIFRWTSRFFLVKSPFCIGEIRLMNPPMFQATPPPTPPQPRPGVRASRHGAPCPRTAAGRRGRWRHWERCRRGAVEGFSGKQLVPNRNKLIRCSIIFYIILFSNLQLGDYKDVVDPNQPWIQYIDVYWTTGVCHGLSENFVSPNPVFHDVFSQQKQ